MVKNHLGGLNVSTGTIKRRNKTRIVARYESEKSFISASTLKIKSIFRLFYKFFFSWLLYSGLFRLNIKGGF